ncbi:MAG TPA: histidine kinase [Gemmatimonadales bacterium]|nr:histidine kinase [Gemmatimonadales bacterium]
MRPRPAALILAFWTVLGLLESSKAYLAEQLRGAEGVVPGVATGWDAALIGNMPWWLLWALLTPLIFRLSAQFRLDGPRWPQSAAVHLGAGTALSALHVIVAGTLYYYTNTRGGPIGSAGAQVESILDSYLVVNLMTYCAVVGVWHALEFARRVRERETTALQLEARAASLEAQMAEARLGMLRMQLDPHFLFNSLNGVSGLVRKGDEAGAVEMLARLGELLRLSLEQRDAHQVTLAREVECLELYLAIERARFGERLLVEWAIDPSLRDALVPAFILQPLAENAVRHGIARTPGAGSVRISARVDEGMLALEVADSGPGLGASRNGHSGIGLANTRARLGHLYGDSAGLRLENGPKHGTIATVTLPLERQARRTAA